MEPIITEGAVRTVETVTSRVVSNKTVVQKTTNTDATHVNRYDAEGNLKSSEVDSKSWEERDTKTYEWSDPADRPPTPPTTAESNNNNPTPAAIIGGELSVEKLVASEQPSPSTEPGATMVMTTTDFVPGAKWSGTLVEQKESNVVPATNDAANNPSDVQTSQRTTTNMSGESWSRSGEAVWICETSKKTPTTPQLPAVENGVAVGVLVDVSASPNSTAAPAATAPANSILQPVSVESGSAVAETAAVQPPPLSVEERRRRRCQENRARKAAMVVDPMTAAANNVVLPPTA